MTPNVAFDDEYKELKGYEKRKDDLINRLLEHVKSLESDLSDAKVTSEHEKTLVRLYYDEKEECRSKLCNLQQSIAELGFVVVLVDGDAMPFLDTLVRRNEQGGQAAARLLRSAALEHARKCHPDLLPGTKVLIRVYANLKGLAATYQRLDILQYADSFFSFQRGFSMDNPLTDFLDAGYGKDRADEKLKESFKVYVLDVHCKHIMFCASADNGYARLLEQYVNTLDICKRISLVEGPPFEAEISRLKHHYDYLALESVFRGSKLRLAEGMSLATDNVRTTPPTTTPAVTVTTQPRNYATTAAQNTTDGSQKVLSMRPQSVHGSRPSETILRNRNGERVDPPRPSGISEVEMLHIKKQKFCNMYHLQGQCTFETTCTHRHGNRLNERQLKVLRCVSRLGPCGNGPRCNDFSCILGHACPRPHCEMRDCRFPRAMHDIDSTVTSRVSP